MCVSDSSHQRRQPNKIKECAQTLVMNGLRGQVRLQADGPKKSPFCLKVLPHSFFFPTFFN